MALGEQGGLALRPSRAQVLSTCINLSVCQQCTSQPLTLPHLYMPCVATFLRSDWLL